MKTLAEKIQDATIGQLHLFFLGQAGFVFKNRKGELLGIDLYLSDCVEKLEKNIGFKRLLPKLLNPDELNFDYVIATHHHYDHFDVDAMPIIMANGHSTLYCSNNCNHYISNMKHISSKVIYVQQGKIMQAGDYVLNFINCDHGKSAVDAVGVIIETDGFKICIVGDSCLRLDRVQEYNKKGKLDILIAPINGAYGNMDEEDCAKLSYALQPGLTIPCHYGMFASHGGNPGLFYAIMKNRYVDNKFILMAMGEELVLER